MREKTVFALGFFDGVHLGHQALLARAGEMAQGLHCQCGAVTFETHPEALLRNCAPGLINSIEDRLKLLRQFGAESTVVLPFDEATKATPWQDFLAMLRMRYGAAGFVCGEDFRFGRGGEGTALLLQDFCREQGIPCAVVPEQCVDGARISSTRIRSALEQGNMDLAAKLLGHDHLLSGTVVAGQRLGRTMGTPTANLEVIPGILLPKWGVYAALASFDGQRCEAVVNIGARPTVGGETVTVEPWLLDFSGDLYGKTVTLFLRRYLRPQKKFGSLEELRTQIQADAQQSREILKK